MYIATQMPLKSTASDFWRLVKDSSCIAIVMLNTLTSSNSSEVSTRQNATNRLYIYYKFNMTCLQVFTVSYGCCHSRKLGKTGEIVVSFNVLFSFCNSMCSTFHE